MIIAKHRNGSLGNIRLKFIDKFAKFADIETDDFELPDSLQPNYDFEAGSNSYTVQSKMNDDLLKDQTSRSKINDDCLIDQKVNRK